MKKINIVKKNTEFNNIIKIGKKYSNDIFYIYLVDNSYPYNRYGISVSKKVGNAVTINLYKRIIKDVIDDIGIKFKGKDIVMISRPKLKFCDYNYIRNSIIKIFGMIGEEYEK